MVPLDDEPSGLLVDMGKFVKSSIDKGVQTIKNLVKPQSETYDAPSLVKTYSLGTSHLGQIFYKILHKKIAIVKSL